jgi:hypothetical protein
VTKNTISSIYIYKRRVTMNEAMLEKGNRKKTISSIYKRRITTNEAMLI